MRRAPGAHALHVALAMAAAAIAIAVTMAVARSAPTFRSLRIGGYCAGMPVYAGPTGPFVGYLIGPAIIASEGHPVSAIDISVVVDGQVRRVWRRERDVERWYTPTAGISPADCRWSRPRANHGIRQPTPLEYGLDARLWPRRFGGGWNRRQGLLTSSDAI